MGTIFVNGRAIFATPDGRFRVTDDDGRDRDFSDFDGAADFADSMPVGDAGELAEAIQRSRG